MYVRACVGVHTGSLEYAYTYINDQICALTDVRMYICTQYMFLLCTYHSNGVLGYS